MEEQVVKALSGREILPQKQFILVRETPEPKRWIVVNVITIKTRPSFDSDRSGSFFMASCRYVNMREISAEEGAAIELSLEEIGCGRNSPLAGAMCRTFPYCELKHEMFAQAVLSDPETWRQHLKDGCLAVQYSKHSVEERSFQVGSNSSLKTSAAHVGWR